MTLSHQHTSMHTSNASRPTIDSTFWTPAPRRRQHSRGRHPSTAAAAATAASGVLLVAPDEPHQSEGCSPRTRRMARVPAAAATCHVMLLLLLLLALDFAQSVNEEPAACGVHAKAEKQSCIVAIRIPCRRTLSVLSLVSWLAEFVGLQRDCPFVQSRLQLCVQRCHRGLDASRRSARRLCQVDCLVAH